MDSWAMDVGIWDIHYLETPSMPDRWVSLLGAVFWFVLGAVPDAQWKQKQGILRLAIERQKGLGESTNLPRVFHGSPPTNDWSAFINVVVGGGRKNPNQPPTWAEAETTVASQAAERSELKTLW